jgi:predicted thioesterase
MLVRKLPITNYQLPIASGYTGTMKPVPIGACGEAEQTVAFEHTLKAYNPDLPPAYSTPHMIGLMEIAGSLALQPFCEGDEVSVGTHIDIRHSAPSTVGARVKAEAVVEAFDGRFYRIRVTAQELAPNPKKIGSGVIERAVVRSGDFQKKMRA